MFGFINRVDNRDSSADVSSVSPRSERCLLANEQVFHFVPILLVDLVFSLFFSEL